VLAARIGADRIRVVLGQTADDPLGRVSRWLYSSSVFRGEFCVRMEEKISVTRQGLPRGMPCGNLIKIVIT
jgi:hypothetical protein